MIEDSDINITDQNIIVSGTRCTRDNANPPGATQIDSDAGLDNSQPLLSPIPLPPTQTPEKATVRETAPAADYKYHPLLAHPILLKVQTDKQPTVAAWEQ